MGEIPEHSEAANEVLRAAAQLPSTPESVSAVIALCESALRERLSPRDQAFVHANLSKFLHHLARLQEGGISHCLDNGIEDSPLALRAESEMCAALLADRSTPERRFFEDPLQRAAYIDQSGALLWCLEARYRKNHIGPQAVVEYLSSKTLLFSHCQGYMPPMLASELGHAYIDLNDDSRAKAVWRAGVASDTARFEEAEPLITGSSTVKMMRENLSKMSAGAVSKKSGCVVLLGLFALTFSVFLCFVLIV